MLREDVLPSLGLSVSAAARALGVTRQALHNILAERASVSAGMALRLGRLSRVLKGGNSDGRPGTRS